MTARRWVTWLVVAGLAALGLVAAVDAIRGEERVRESDARAPAVPGLADQPELAIRQLREAGVTGVLTYADDECRLHAVSLPNLELVRAPSFEMCRPATSTGGLGVVAGEVVWAGLGYGAVQTVLSQEELSRALRTGLGIPADADAGFRAVQAASLGGGRYVVLADSTYEPRERVLAGLDGSRVRFVHPRWWVGGARAIRPSPRGRYYALLGSEPLGAKIYTRAGRAVGIAEGIPAPRAVAWSPDDRWTAVATRGSIYVFASARPQELVIRVPLTVRDLDWTGAATAVRSP
ncbi:MAG: hypothetical protein ACRDNG_08110 [Gaiellaceae bacterium]